MRHIPATMATQHPDNACAPYWEEDGDGFVSTYEEVAECFSSYRDLGCEEYMWDWEGKYVEEAVVERLFHGHYEYFRRHPLGKEKFLTFRIPNIWQEKGHSLSRAMMGMLTAEDVARSLDLHAPPLFEVILPMTTGADQIMHINRLFSKLSKFSSALFGHRCTLPRINVMPLFEGVDHMFASRPLLNKFLADYRATYKTAPDHLRLHIARSDPALNSGMVAAVVAGKFMLSEFYRFGEDHGLPVFPAVGAGLLPFRGGLAPDRLPDFFRQYAGVRTAYIQSAFRYDYPLAQAKAAIRRLNRELPLTKPDRFDRPADKREAQELCRHFAAAYRRVAEKIAPTINRLALSVPRRRERKLHIGLFGYSRRLGSKPLPRAIPFTAGLYSIGLPPEFLGTGHGLAAAAAAGLNLERFYPILRADLVRAGRYLNKKNLDAMAARGPAWRRLREDVSLTEKHLGLELGPKMDSDFAHREIP